MLFMAWIVQIVFASGCIMTDFLMITVPADGDPQRTLANTKQRLAQFPAADFVSELSIPLNLKMGTLDVLVGLSDEFAKLDVLAESVTRKVANYMGEILEEQRQKLDDNLLIRGVTFPKDYVVNFQWETAKFPINLPLKNLFEVLSSNISRIETELRNKSANYNAIKGSLQAIEKKQTGSLLTRNLYDIVKKQHVVEDSEFLITLIVVVPRYSHKDWLKTYETLCDYVVPRSSEIIFEDQDNFLCTVTVFRKMAGDFKNAARQHRFVVRDFSYDEEEMKKNKNILQDMEKKKRHEFPVIFRWLRTQFSDAFILLMHVKILRLFIETVLRYGLPLDFVGILIAPKKKSMADLRKVLQNMYGHLDKLSLSSTKDDEVTGTGWSHGEYYPYVSVTVNTTFSEQH